jgi:MoaA/NifB/PqqE/SkfB family radical SAM enzyme
MLAYDEIKWIHVEPTTYCNAWCPACARNKSGYELSKSFKLQHLDPIRFEKTLKKFPSLKTVQMCGTFGDPIACAWIDILVEQCVDQEYELRIHTNGGLRSETWWSELGTKLSNHEHTVIFGIDGLAGVHEIHRQGTKFEKVIANAKAFISAGGNAEWQFLLFKHNEHQVKDCMKLSQQLGFKKFYTRNSIRVPNPARNYLTGEEYTIERVNEFKTKETYELSERTVQVKDCMHLNLPSVYLTAQGKITPCCYLKDLDYNNNTVDEEIKNNNASEFCRKSCGVKNV